MVKVKPNKSVPVERKKRLGKRIIIGQFLSERSLKYTKAEIEKERAYYRSLMKGPNDVMPQKYQPRSRGRPRKVVSDAKVEKGDNVEGGRVEPSYVSKPKDLADIVQDEIVGRVVPIGEEEDRIKDMDKFIDYGVKYMYANDRMGTFVRYQTEEEVARAKRIRRAEIVAFNAKFRAYNETKRKKAKKIGLKKQRLKALESAAMLRLIGYYRLPPKLRGHPLRGEPFRSDNTGHKKHKKLKGFKKVGRHIEKFEAMVHLEHDIFDPDKRPIKINKIFAELGDGYESLTPSEYGPIYSKLLEFARFFFKFSSYHDRLSEFSLNTFPIRWNKNTMGLKSMYYFFMKEILDFDTKLYFRLENIIGYGFQRKNIRNSIFFESIRRFYRFDKFTVDDLNIDKINEEFIREDTFCLRFPLNYLMILGNYVPYLRSFKYNEYSATYKNHYSPAEGAMNKRDYRLRRLRLKVDQFTLWDSETLDYYEFQERLFNNNFLPYSVSTPFNTLLDTKTIWTSGWNNDYDINIDIFKLSRKILLITSSLCHFWRTLSKFAKPFKYFLRTYDLNSLYKFGFISRNDGDIYPKTITYSLGHLDQMMRYMKFDPVNWNIFRFLQDRLKLIRKDFNGLESDIFNLSTTTGFNFTTIRGVHPEHKDLYVWDYYEIYPLYFETLFSGVERMDQDGIHKYRKFRLNKTTWEENKDRVEYIGPEPSETVSMWHPNRIRPDLKDLFSYDLDFNLHEWPKRCHLLEQIPSLLLGSKTVEVQSIPNFYTDIILDLNRNDHRLFFRGFKYNLEYIVGRINRIDSSQHDYIMKLNALGNFIYNEVQAIVGATQYIYSDCISTARSQLEAIGNPRVYHAFDFINDLVFRLSSQGHVHYGNSNLSKKKELFINYRYSEIVLNRWYEYNYDGQFHLYLMECYGEYADYDYIAEYNDEEFDEKHGLKYHMRRFEERVASGEYDAKMNMLKERSLARKAAAYERQINPPLPKVYPWELIRWGNDYTAHKKRAERLMQKYIAPYQVYRRTMRRYIKNLKRSAEGAAIQQDEEEKRLIYDPRIRLTKKDKERVLLIEGIKEKLSTLEELEQRIRKKSREINKEEKARRKAREISLAKARAKRALKRAEAKAFNKEERARKRVLKKEEEIRMRALRKEEKARERMLKKEEEIRMRALSKEERARERMLEKEKRARERMLEKEERARERMLEKEKRARDRTCSSDSTLSEE